LIEKFFTSRSQPIELFLEGVSGAQAGESVIVGIKPEKLLHSAWLMYAPPLIGLFIGLALAVWLSSLWRIQSEWLQGMGLLVGLFCGFGVCRWRSSRISTHPEYQPRFIRKASETDPSCSVPHE
jgi:positive regulator of sigma E activity